MAIMATILRRAILCPTQWRKSAALKYHPSFREQFDRVAEGAMSSSIRPRPPLPAAQPWSASPKLIAKRLEERPVTTRDPLTRN